MIQGNEIHSYRTRLADDFRISQHRTGVYSKLPSQAGVALFNKLPNKIKNIENFKHFKKQLMEFLLLNTFYSLEEFLEHSDEVRNI